MRTHSRINEAVVRANRTKVVDVFTKLRKQGFVARANFMCCQNCAGTDIAVMIGKMPKEKSEKVKGIVFWHRQDEEHIWDDGTLCLAFGDVDTTEHGKIGMEREEAGKLIVKELEEAGLKVEWDGSGDTRILVDLKVGTEEEVEPVRPEKKALRVTGPDGWNGNVFSIMGNTKKCLEKVGTPKEMIDKVLAECKKSDYSHAVTTCMNALTEAGYQVS